QNQSTRGQVEELLRAGRLQELRARLCQRLSFGTAGLRAAMGAGFGCINDLTIIQATQGIYTYLERTFPDLRQRGFVVGYDARAQGSCSSLRLAKLTAAVLLAREVPVHFFSTYVPTPFVPYAVQQLQAVAGVMITASHNRKEDNGYKVYWENGAQVTSPHDKEMLQCMEQCLEPWAGSWEESLVDSSPLRQDPLSTICHSYMQDLTKLCYHRELNQQSPLRVVHSSFHGVGHSYVQEAFRAFGLQPPTPGVGGGHGAPEPVPSARSGTWKVFSGNELAALLGWWLLSCWRGSAHPGAVTSQLCMLATTPGSCSPGLGSGCQGALSSSLPPQETLPGFKWIGSRAKALLEAGREVLFAFEESIGFMCGSSVLDKDGVSAAVVVAEMASFLQAQGLSLAQKLTQVYERYGYHLSRTSYFLCYDPGTAQGIFERLRNFGGPRSYPRSCGTFPVRHLRDLTRGYDSSQPGGRAVLPASRSSQMLTFTFQNGAEATLRTSGTEPKIKFYAELCALP
ncbi:PGM2L synthase, partial [Indicator maculatus]|nr:PGM2L synthase [Indicator maculatus]